MNYRVRPRPDFRTFAHKQSFTFVLLGKAVSKRPKKSDSPAHARILTHPGLRALPPRTPENLL